MRQGGARGYLTSTHRVSSSVSSTQTLRPRVVCAEVQPRVGDFLRLGNDAIQPLEKSVTNPRICNNRFSRACGLQDFDAGEAGRRRAWREWNRALNEPPAQQANSAGTRRNPRKHAGPRNKKGQPRVVGLYELVEGSGI
jgi:hypothetical protein